MWWRRPICWRKGHIWPQPQILKYGYVLVPPRGRCRAWWNPRWRAYQDLPYFYSPFLT